MRKIFLNTNDIAELLGFSIKTLRSSTEFKKLIKSNAIPQPIKISRKKQLWYIDDVEKWLNEKGFTNINLQKFMDEE